MCSPIFRGLTHKKGRRQEVADILSDERFVMPPQKAQRGGVGVTHPVVCVGGEHPIVDGAQGHTGFGALAREPVGCPIEDVRSTANFFRRIAVEQRADCDGAGQDIGLAQTHPVKVAQPASQGHLDNGRADQQKSRRHRERQKNQLPQLGSDRIRGELQAQHAVVGATDANHLVRITQALRDEMDQPSGRRNIVVVLMVVAHCELAAADVDELRLFQCAGVNDTL